MTSKQRVHAAMRGQMVDRVPLTPIFMAWAAHFIGRSYRDYYLDHRAMCAAQMAVVERFKLDQVSTISDPWRETDAFGMELDYPEQGVGIPRRHVLEQAGDVAKLKPYQPLVAKRTRDRIDAVAVYAKTMGQTHSILGWVEGPLAEYADLRGLETACMDLMDEPELFHRAAEVIVACAIEFAREQISRGADVIGVGDAAVSVIGPELYRRHVLPWQQKLMAGIHQMGGTVKLHICGNIAAVLPDMVKSGADAIDVDWMVPMGEARRLAGPRVCLCGNVDPAAVLLRGTPAENRAAALACVRDAGGPFILQPGCEIPPGTPIENIEAFCAAVGK